MSIFNSANIDDAVATANSSTFEGPTVEGGLYPAVIVGIQDVSSTFENKLKNGFRLIFQYEDDEGKRWHITSKQMDFNLYEKSNFAKFISAWFGCANQPEEIAKKLRAAKFVLDNGTMDWSAMLGKPLALNLVMQPSKKDPEKSYVTLMGMQACTKKTGKIEAQAEEMPAFLNTVYAGQVNDAIYLDGMTFANPSEKKEEAPTAPTPVAPAPSAPAPKKASQRVAPVNTPAPAPAPAPAATNDDEDLPF